MRRRDFVLLPLAALPLGVAAQAPNAHISTTDPLVYSFTKGRPVMPGRVTLELPAIADNGNSVPMTVKVASPMTPAEYVRSVRLIAEKNPIRDMATFYLGPRCPRAEIASRIRLNGTQRVVAIAELSDGSFWSDAAQIEVQQAACTEGD